MRHNKSVVIAALFGIIGAVVYFNLFDEYAPQASVDLKYSRNEIIGIARGYLDKLGYDVSKFDADANFNYDSGTAIYLENYLGLKNSNALLKKDSLNIHSWDIYFFDRSLAPSQMRDQYNVRISPAGKVFGFDHRLSDSTAIASVSQEQAKQLSESFLISQGHDIDKFKLEKSSVNDLVGRKDYTFFWTSRDSVYNMSPRVWVDVHGNQIGRYRFQLQEPESFRKEVSSAQTFVTYVVTSSSMATFVLLIFIITLFLKKYHDGEVGVKTAILIFVILFGLTIAEQSLSFTNIGYGTFIVDLNRFNVRIIVFIMTVFIVQAFIAAMVFAGWSVGESSARRGWSDKLKAIDGLFFGKPFTLEFANAIVRGYAFGFIILAVIAATTAYWATRSNFGMFLLSLNGIAESFAPSLNAIFLALRLAILNEVVFRFFFIAWLREKTKRTWPGILISSLLWTLLAFNLWDFPFGYLAFPLLFSTYFVFSILLGLIVVKFDLMTAIVTNFIVLVMGYAIPMLVASSAFFQTQSIIFYGFLTFPLLIASVGYVKRQTLKLSLELTPTHIKRISERERMARELEIARSVQMSLLPKENPLTEGYDIAGVCIPALEVGGDYYDFFQLGEGKIGIAIGDVSGKGVPAAIYMTLTKGILQSHAGENFSPKEVLNKLNRQMYINIERNCFVSMFYAVLDMQKHKIRFSRAGHNAAILAQSSTNTNTLVQPKGMALGLEAGPKFNDSLEEHELPLQSGDVLTFYTDGFTEASNVTGEEFGEQRLEEVISENKHSTANGVIQKVVRSVKSFVGNNPQHDDMTMVVIKVI